MIKIMTTASAVSACKVLPRSSAAEPRYEQRLFGRRVEALDDLALAPAQPLRGG